MVFVVIILGFLISILPLGSPYLSIVLSAIVWPLVYLATYSLSLGFDPTQSLPWYIADPERMTLYLVVMLAIFGVLIGGFIGLFAMMMFWVPLLLLPTWLLYLGVSVEHKYGWTGYMLENYEDSCRMRGDSYVCRYTPVNGKALPTFVQDDSIGKERIMAVYPYKGVSDPVARPDLKKDLCRIIKSVSGNAEITMEVCD